MKRGVNGRPSRAEGNEALPVLVWVLKKIFETLKDDF
jgi:hypothetical protein